jgi:hypothetical protein
MNIKFTGHQATERNLELTQKDLFNLFELMRKEFKEHITYASFNSIRYPTEVEKAIRDFCDSYNVDCEYSKDRVNFFSAILTELRNPYQ